MNDSRDLRKRILKMREINNIDQKNAPFIRSSEQDNKLNHRIQINVLETNKNKIKKVSKALVKASKLHAGQAKVLKKIIKKR